MCGYSRLCQKAGSCAAGMIKRWQWASRLCALGAVIQPSIVLCVCGTAGVVHAGSDSTGLQQETDAATDRPDAVIESDLSCLCHCSRSDEHGKLHWLCVLAVGAVTDVAGRNAASCRACGGLEEDTTQYVFTCGALHAVRIHMVLTVG